MRAVVNGEEQALAVGTTVEMVVRSLAGVPERGVAVALDREVVPRAAWGDTVIEDGQEVEVLQAVAGG